MLNTLGLYLHVLIDTIRVALIYCMYNIELNVSRNCQPTVTFLTYSKNILYILQYIYIYLLDIFILLIRVLIDTILEALIYCMYIIELNVSHITNSFFSKLHQYVTITKCNNTKFT